MTNKLTPVQQYQADCRQARDLNALREAYARYMAATGLPAEPLRGNMPAPDPTDRGEALREAFGRLLPTDQVGSAAAGRYNAPVEAPAPLPHVPDAFDQRAEARNMPPGSAAIMRRGRFQ